MFILVDLICYNSSTKAGYNLINEQTLYSFSDMSILYWWYIIRIITAIKYKLNMV